MAQQINLIKSLDPKQIEKKYWDYKESKTDRFRRKRIRIPMGVDGITWQNFEQELSKNANNISKRVLDGKYLFYPFREKEVSKDGKTRTLSIASIRDVLVQALLYDSLYESIESEFAVSDIDMVSFGYRRGKSAPKAARMIWRSINQEGYKFILDADISKFFDTLDHERLLRLLDERTYIDDLTKKLLYRYIKTGGIPYDEKLYDSKNRKKWKIHFQTSSAQRLPRTKGVPQGGILSGLLANLYLNEFDTWVIRDLGAKFDLKYFRYADDFVILTRNDEAANAVYKAVLDKIREFKLELHPLGSKKTKIIDIENENLLFLGFKFTNKYVAIRPKTVSEFKTRFKESLTKESKFRFKSKSRLARLQAAITYFVNPKIVGYEAEVCETCGGYKDRAHNWISFFATTITHLDQLKQLDRWMRKVVCKYFRDRYRIRVSRQELRKAGMKSMVGEYYKNRESHRLCICDISEIYETDN